MELAPPGKEFITSHGEKIRSIIELRYALEIMDPLVFDQHVTPQKNDFAIWLKDVFDRDDIAKKVREAATREGIIAALTSFTEQGRSVEELSVDQQKSSDDIFLQSEMLKERIRSLRKSADDVKQIDRHEPYYLRLTKVQQRFLALRGRISQYRKEGKDMFIPELLTRSIKTKFQYLEFAQSEEDLTKCDKLLDQLEREITEAAQELVVDVAKEIEEQLRADAVDAKQKAYEPATTVMERGA